MAGFIPLFLSGARSGTIAGIKISVATTALAESVENEQLDPYAAAKHELRQGNFLRAALETGKTLGGIAGYVGVSTGTFFAANSALTMIAAKTIGVTALGVTTLPLGATIAIGAASVLLASGAGSAVIEYAKTQSLHKALRAGVDGIVNPLPVAGIYLAGMNRSVEPPWPNYLGIPELIKSQRVHTASSLPDQRAEPPAPQVRQIDSSVKEYPALTTASIQAELSSDTIISQDNKTKPADATAPSSMPNAGKKQELPRLGTSI